MPATEGFDLVEERLERLVQAAVDVARAPAISVGVTSLGRNALASAGLARVEPSAQAHVRTRFEIGSITKVWTATAVLRLVEKGCLSLDDRLTDLLNGFQLADGAGHDITPRHLLSHTSGIELDHYGDPATATISEALPDLRAVPQKHPAGRSWAYLNLGYLLLGAVIEQVTGLTFADAMRAEVLLPLGDTTTEITPGMSERAVGYRRDRHSGRLFPEEPGRFPAFAPAGSTPTSTAESLLRLVYPHLNDGRGPTGETFLAPESVAEMARLQAHVPANAERKVGWGLGWGRYQLQDGSEVLGHGGSTFGFVSYLVAAPEHRFAVAILVNSEDGIATMRNVGDSILQLVLGSGLYD